MSADALTAIAKATELFLEFLATKAHTAAKSAKRRNIKFADIEKAVRYDKRLVDMGLKDVLAEDIFAEVSKAGAASC